MSEILITESALSLAASDPVQEAKPAPKRAGGYVTLDDLSSEMHDRILEKCNAAIRESILAKRAVKPNSCARCNANHFNGPAGLCTPCGDEMDAEFGKKEPATCRDCSAPATTERGYCAYCSNRVGWGQSYFSESEIGYAMQIHKHRENDQARARMLAADERERPKSSATSREMAKAHPWHSDENEP